MAVAALTCWDCVLFRAGALDRAEELVRIDAHLHHIDSGPVGMVVFVRWEAGRLDLVDPIEVAVEAILDLQEAVAGHPAAVEAVVHFVPTFLVGDTPAFEVDSLALGEDSPDVDDVLDLVVGSPAPGEGSLDWGSLVVGGIQVDWVGFLFAAQSFPIKSTEDRFHLARRNLQMRSLLVPTSLKKKTIGKRWIMC